MTNLFSRIALKLHGGVITLKPQKKSVGRVLMSYTTLPFIDPRSIDNHSNRWESKCMAEIWRERGFTVDIVDFNDENFVPKKQYAFCIDISHHLEKFTPRLGPDCIKIFHIPAAHWKFQNDAELAHLAVLEKRRGIKLAPKRLVPPSKNIEMCDIATILGNNFTIGTYAYAEKKIIRIPISTTHLFPSPEDKDFDKIRKSYIWLGGAGMAHKGLDLVLEAFSAMPDFNLVVFGKKDIDFAEVYKKELFETPNIRYAGMVELNGKDFTDTAQNSLGIIFPSCSEGSAGSVVSAMHAGLIPIISYQSGVDVDDFGSILKKNSSDEIQKEILILSHLPAEVLKSRSIATWKHARDRHTRETFLRAYEDFVDGITKGILLK